MNKMNKISIFIFICLSFALNSLAQNNKKGDKNTKTDSKDIYGGLKFRNIGPALMSGRISDIVIHPNNEKLSQIPYLKFNGLIEKHFGSELKEVNLDKFVYKGPNNKKYSSNNKKSKSQLSRKPASLDEEKEESGTTSGMIGLVILLAFLGFYSAYLSKGNSNSK